MDGLYLKTGIHSIPPAISVSGSLETRTNPTQISALGRSSEKTSSTSSSSSSSSSSRFSFGYPLRSWWFGRGVGNDRHKNSNAKHNKYKGIALDDGVLVENGGGGNNNGDNNNSDGQNGNWVLKILHVKSLWKEDGDFKVVVEDGMESDGGVVRSSQNSKEEEEARHDNGVCGDCHGDDECDECSVIDDDDEKEVEFDRDSFSKLLKKVPLAQARLYAQMSYLGNLAYSVSELKPSTVFKYRNLRYVTSSAEKRELRTKTEIDEVPMEVQEEDKVPKETNEGPEQKGEGYRLSTSTAYQIAASAASYLHSHARSILPFNSSKASTNADSLEGDNQQSDSADIMNSEMASLMATTDSVTAVVAAKEEVKQAVADDLRSVSSSPCEWFICDDDESHTRFFVIQGSESLASWQANLLFEPVQFEGFDVHVHRGIYEAAKGIYEQILPEVHAHLKSHGNRATLRFAGHSLGGSLSLLINLMLLIRGEAPASSLLPVITFGAPSVMCGGDRLLRELGLPKSHVQSITMHRDIVPRAFSCHYPDHIAKILKAVNGKFRSHSCLNNENLLFAPMGEFFILQPDKKFSPHHHLLPSGSGLYVLSCELEDVADAEKHLRAAKKVFMNSPHPLEILSDRSAYGSGGTIQRDHDMNSYLKSVRAVIRQDLNRIRKAKRENRRKFWWPLVAPRGINAGIILTRPLTSNNLGQDQFVFSGILQTGRESLKRFSRLVASQHMHLLVIFLFPARLLLLGAYAVKN